MGWRTSLRAVKAIDRSGGPLVRVLRHVKRWQPDVIYVATAHNRPGLLRDIPSALALPKGAPPLVVHFHGSESGRLGVGGPALFDMASRLFWSTAQPPSSCSLRRSATSGDDSGPASAMKWFSIRSCRRPARPLSAPTTIRGASAGAALHRPADPQQRSLRPARWVEHRGAQHPCRLRIAGIGPESEALRRRILLMGLEDHVDLLGYVEGGDLDRVYREADAFVLPSYFAEGFPLLGHGGDELRPPRRHNTGPLGSSPTTSSRARMPSSSLRDGPIWSRPP